MIKFKMTGIEEVRRSLETLQKRAQILKGPVPFDELFPPEFMRQYTDFKTMDDMLGGYSPPISSIEEFDQVPDAAWNAYVTKTTQFQSWDEMQSVAARAYIQRRLGLDRL
jgi:hypothetical protein